MMGTGHAATGAATWLALTATTIPGLHLIAPGPDATLVGALIVAGAALAPDWDHPSSTVAHSLPGGGAIATGIATMAGGHRKGMHALLAAALVWPLLHLASLVRWAPAGWPHPLPVLTLALTAGCLALAVKALHLSGSWPSAWITGIVTTIAISTVAPNVYAWLPVCVALGYTVHLAGDMLTVGGVPLLWPVMPKPPVAVVDNPLAKHLWLPNGFFSVPILGTTGSWREWALTIAASAYIAWGFWTLIPQAAEPLIKAIPH